MTKHGESLDAQLLSWLAIQAGTAFHVSDIGAQFSQVSWACVRNALWRLRRSRKIVSPVARYWMVEEPK